MSEPQRYELLNDDMCPTPYGNYVRHHDYGQLAAEMERLKQAVSCSHGTFGQELPRCPKCGSEEGSLGTSAAYFICRACGREQYWTEDHEHPGDWLVALKASPWGRHSELVQQYEAKLETLDEIISQRDQFRADLIRANQTIKAMGESAALWRRHYESYPSELRLSDPPETKGG